MKPYSQPIFTLDARGNIMLELMSDYFKLDNNVMHREIQGMHMETQRVLATKGIPYEWLKAALVPTSDRNEAGFIFDSQQIESSWYGGVTAKMVLPLLDKRTTQSVLCGDLLGKDQDFIFNIFDESIVLSRSFEFIHGTLLYCVYINNLSDAALQNIHQQLSELPAYVGYIPATYQTRGKTYLSTTLVNAFLKYGDTVIMGHEDDRPNEENVNMLGYAFEDFGYKVCSLQSSYFGLFLGYKVERAVYPGFEVDTEMSLNAVSQHVVPLAGCTVRLDEAKHEYLRTKKIGKLQKAGIAEMGRDQLVALIKEKISSNYIYNLVFLEEYGVVKFNLILEVPREGVGYATRLVAALEYMPHEKTIRVITLY